MSAGTSFRGSSRRLRTAIAGALACACSLALAGPALAATFTVDDLSDVGDAGIDGTCDATGADTCTLRAALEEANNTAVGSDNVNVSTPGTINLALGPLVISEVITVNGDAGGTTIDAGGASRVLQATSSSVTLNDLRLEDGATLDDDGAGITSTATLLTLNRVTVTGNTVNSASGGFGGAGIKTFAVTNSLVLNDSTVSGNTIIGLSGFGAGIRAGGPLTLNRSTVSGNSTTLDAGGRGGGIDMAPPSAGPALTISNSTISGNHSGGTATGGGGGVFASNNVSSTTIVASTIAGNTTTGGGGGVRIDGSNPRTSENTIYAANTAGIASTNCGLGSLFTTPENNIDSGTSCGFGTGSGNQENVSAGALGLGALASNGGPTETMAIASGGAAHNAASGDCGGLTVDQRGVSRPQSGTCDIGAFELEPPPPTPPATPSTSTPTTTKKKCKKGRKLKKGKCVKKKKKKRKKK